MTRLALHTKFGWFELLEIEDHNLVFVNRPDCRISLTTPLSDCRITHAVIHITLDHAGMWSVTFADCSFENYPSYTWEKRLAKRLGRIVLRSFQRAALKRPDLAQRCRAAIEASRVAGLIRELDSTNEKIRSLQAAVIEAEERTATLAQAIATTLGSDGTILEMLMLSDDAQLRLTALRLGVPAFDRAHREPDGALVSSAS